MATLTQIRGMLLEEALLYLLRKAGYQTVEQAGSDPTLNDGHSGLEVLGRGHKHQIDAVADYAVAQPFSHPQRLLVEAKFYKDKNVGLSVVRNGVGVLKDVSEYWVVRANRLPEKRYHYQYSVFSAFGFSKNAQRYAFAQDIYLIQIQRSRRVQPILQAIGNLTPADFNATNRRIQINMTALRRAVRERLKGTPYAGTDNVVQHAMQSLNQLFAACQQLDGALLGMIDRQFPVFLVPEQPDLMQNLRDQYRVSIHWHQNDWYLRERNRRENLFSFDLPGELFLLYAEKDMLSPTQALNLKEERMSQIQATVRVGDQLRLITFDLDHDWLRRVRNRLQNREDD